MRVNYNFNDDKIDECNYDSEITCLLANWHCMTMAKWDKCINAYNCAGTSQNFNWEINSSALYMCTLDIHTQLDRNDSDQWSGSHFGNQD